MASFAPWPDFLLPLRAAVRDKPEDARRLMMARFGLIPPQSFFNLENMQRLLVAVPAAGEGTGSVITQRRQIAGAIAGKE